MIILVLAVIATFIGVALSELLFLIERNTK